MSIQTFGNKETERFFISGRTRAPWQQVKHVVARKLDQLDAAADIGDLQSPPGNRLEQLSGDRKGFWSIRVNDQWRIVFRWSDAGPSEVTVADYH